MCHAALCGQAGDEGGDDGDDDVPDASHGSLS